MAIMIDALLQELEQEAQTTRRVLERVPQEHMAGSRTRSRCRSVSSRFTSRQLPGGVAELVDDLTGSRPPTFVQPQARTSAELIPALDAEQSPRRSRSSAGSTIGGNRHVAPGLWRS